MSAPKRDDGGPALTDPTPLRTVADNRRDLVVACLEQVLVDAKVGKYAAITVCAESLDDDAMYWYHTPCKETFVEMLGKLDVLKWKVYQRMNDSTFPVG